MATKNTILGTVPKSRGRYTKGDTTTKWYYDNILEYKGSSFRCISEASTGITGAPATYNANTHTLVPNAGWEFFVDNTGALDVGERLTENEEKLSELETEVIYDVTANNNGATFVSLSALLSSENLSTIIPTSVRHGGMSIRFVQSSDNKYIQYRLMNQSWSTVVTDWQGVDNEPTAGSENLVKSGGVVEKLFELESKIGVTISYTDVIPSNGEYVNRTFHLKEGKDAGLSVNANDILQEGTIIRFYIYKRDDSRDIAYVLNNQYYDSVRALFNNYAGEITGYAYYITTFNVGDVITSFTCYGLDKEVKNVKKDVDNAQLEISNTANNLAYTQALAGGETHIYVDVKQGANLEPETKYSFPIKSGAKITFSADLYDVVSGTVYVYLWYSDGTESSGYRIGSKISIDKNVDYIGLYIPYDSIIKDGSIMIAAIYENTTLNTAIEYVDSKDKVYKLVGIGPKSTIYNNWQVGDLYFNTKDNKIFECVSINPFDTKPTEILQKGLLYLCDNILYTFDGLSLTKYHDKDVINGVLIDYQEFLVGENINNDSTGGDKSTYIYKDLIKFDIDADEEIEISCDEIIDAVSSTPIRVYGYDADGHETEIKTLTYGIHVVAPSLSYNSIKVRLYPTTSGMSAWYCTFKNIRIRKYKRTDIPAYYIKDNYIQNKIDVIRQKMADANGNFDAFAFITDLHWPRNAKNSPAIINYLQDRVQLPRVIMGGDYADGINMDYIKAFNGFRGKIYRAIGNHEYMNYWEEDGIFSQKDITDANIWAIYQSGMTDIVIGNANTNYYYVDNVVQKMRYIILSVFTDGSAGKFEQAQATWLNDSLANMPNGYTAIVIAHHYAHINYPDFTPILTPIGKQIADVCDAHVGKVACMLQGHTHEDLMMKTDGGIPIFATTCDKSTADPDETSEEAHYIYDKRINGTITEQAFDIVIINKTDKKVSLVRIGAPADKDGVDFYEAREQTYL